MKNYKKAIISTVAALVIVLGGLGIYDIWEENRVASIVLLDVNPSIEIKVNDDADVVAVNALNSDAQEVLQGMRLKGADADTAINAIIGSLLKHGYVDELANSILLTVEDNNTVRGAELQAELTQEINQILSATSVNAAILAQHVNENGAEDISNEYNISSGKAALIKSILEVNNTYETKDLANLSVNELNLILSNPKNEVKDIVSTGNANDSAYIGGEKAKQTAFTHAGVSESDVRKVEVDFDYEYGKMVYEVEFSSGEYEYDYSVAAESGEVLHSHREYDDDYVVSIPKSETAGNTATEDNSSSNQNEDIGKEGAKKIALEHAGTTESQTTRLTVEREYDDGQLEYHVEFRVGNKEYDYEISGTTGRVLDYDIDVENDRAAANENATGQASSNQGTTNTSNEESVDRNKANTGSENTSSSQAADIGKEQAKSVALAHAGLSESKATRLRVERDLDDGRIEYSVEFTSGNQEYDYEIDGATGRILDYDVEREDWD